MYSNVQSLKMYKERDLFLVYKNMVEFIDAISYKLSEQYVVFTTWFGTVLNYSVVWKGFNLQHCLKYLSCFFMSEQPRLTTSEK